MRGLTDQQRADRQLGIGGSDAGRIMAGDWNALWLEKTGRAQPENLDWKISVQIGHCTEQFNAEYFEHVTGRAVSRRNEAVVSEAHPWMRANLDGITTNSQGRGAYWDAKHVGRSDEAMVLRYTPQMVHCCTIVGLDYWILSVLVGNTRHEIIEQEVDPFYQQELIEREREFWQHVIDDEEPRDRVESVLAPKPEKRLRNIDLGERGDPAWPKVVAQYNWAQDASDRIQTFVGTDAAAKAHAISREELKAIIPEDVGLLTCGRFKASRNKAGALTMVLLKPGEADAQEG